MMKISDPIMFGYGFTAFVADVFAKHQDRLDALNVNPNMGISDLACVAVIPDSTYGLFHAEFECYY